MSHEEKILVGNEINKFEINEDTLLFSLSLENDNTGSDVESKALKEGFKKQNKRHITILGGSTKKLLKDALSQLDEDERKKILEEIIIFLKSLSWQLKPTEIYKIQKQDYFGGSTTIENRQSYINLIDMPDMNLFYAKLKSLLKIDFPMQVPHITLFTKGESENPKYYGIPLSSIDDFNKMNPEKFLDIT